VRVGDRDLHGLKPRGNLHVSAGCAAAVETVRDNVALGLILAGSRAPTRVARAAEWLARVGLTPFMAHYPSHLSVGSETRRHGSELDHRPWDRAHGRAFSALDVHTRSGWKRAAGAVESSKKTVVFVTHDLEEAIALATRSSWLSAGPRADCGTARRDARAPARSHGAADGAAFVTCIARSGRAARRSRPKSARAEADA